MTSVSSPAHSTALPGQTNLLHRLTLQHGWLVVTLVLAVVMRLPYLPTYGHSDLAYFYNRAAAIKEHGLLSIYTQEEGKDFNYPPLYFLALRSVESLWSDEGNQDSPLPPTDFLIWHKLLQLGADLLLIGSAYYWLPRHTRLKWILPLLLAVYPGLILVSVLWGQTDTLWTAFLVLTLMALNRDHPRIGAICAALALLTKFQAVIVLPVLVILCLRRYGLRETIVAGGIGAGVLLAVLLPFMLTSGFDRVIRPFTAAVDFFPSTTVWALNLWYVGIPSVWGAGPPLLYDTVSDSQLIFGLVTYKQAGLLMLGLYTVLILVHIWKHGHERREFVWAAALCFGFFMLPTQMHERYLHPAAIFLVIAAAQDKRCLPLALGLLFTYSYNVIVPLHAPFYWLGVNWLFALGDITLYVALLNLILFAGVTWAAVSSPESVTDHPASRRVNRWVWRMSAVTASLLIVGLVVRVIFPDPLRPNTQTLDVGFGDSARLTSYGLTQNAGSWTLRLYWMATAPIEQDYTVFVHAVRDGTTVAQCDGLPQGGAYPTWRWFNGRMVETDCTLPITDNGYPDALYAGLYDAQTMQNLPITQNGQAVPDGRARVWEQVDG